MQKNVEILTEPILGKKPLDYNKIIENSTQLESIIYTFETVKEKSW